MQALLTKLSHLDHSLSKFLILRASFGACRINHLLRALPFLVGQKLAVEVGHLFRSAFSECAGGGVDTLHFDLACLLTFCGGLGLRDPETVHESAFLAAAFTCSAGADDLPTCFWEDATEACGFTRTAYGFPEAMLGVDFTNTQMPDWSNQRWW